MIHCFAAGQGSSASKKNLQILLMISFIEVINENTFVLFHDIKHWNKNHFKEKLTQIKKLSN